MKCEYEQKQFIVLILYWKKLKIGILIMRVKITKSYTVILENWYLQLLIQYLLKEKVIDKCFCGFGWCPLSVTWCDHIHHSPTRSPASSSSQDPPKEMEEEEKTHNLPYITRRVTWLPIIGMAFPAPISEYFFVQLLSRSESYGNSYVYGRYLNRSLSFKRDQTKRYLCRRPTTTT